ncbi:MAG: glycosyltransferase [Bacillota bacterium]
MAHPTLSICLIVKNEEKVIKRCLESIKDVADEVIVVDTGCTDSTIQIAKEFQARVIASTWCDDFSFVRNIGLKEAKGHWILVLDADEELCKEDTEALKIALLKPVEGYCLPVISYIDNNRCNYVTDYVCRLFRNDQNYCFKNRIHEEIYTSIVGHKGWEAVVNLPVRIFHYGYIEECVNQKDKNIRNLKLLKFQLEDCSWEDRPYYLYALGVEYFQAEQYLQGAELLRQALESSPASSGGFRSDCYLKLILCELNRDNNQVEETFQKALKEYPDFADLLFLKGQVLYQQLRFKEAISFFNECLKLPLSPRYTSAAGVNSYRSWYLKGMCYYYLGCSQQSEECFTRSLEIEPNYFPPLKGWVELRLKFNKPIELNSALFKENMPFYLYQIGVLLWYRGSWQPASELWKKSLELGFKEAQKRLYNFQQLIDSSYLEGWEGFSKPDSCLIDGSCTGCEYEPVVSQERLIELFFNLCFINSFTKIKDFLINCSQIKFWETFLEEVIEAMGNWRDAGGMRLISGIIGLKPKLLVLCTANLAYGGNLYGVEKLLPRLPLSLEEKEIIRINTWICRAGK